MAYLKILARKFNLDGCAAYAANEEKTVEDIAGYALDTEKTERKFYTSAHNCGSVETAGAEMWDTKKRFDKEGKVLCYHLIQSFAPGEGTPELIHKIGVDFCKECFGDFEAVIGTHLDKGHLHNHIVVNSVSFADGHKYRSTPKSLYALRAVSDRLCRENGLSVIQTEGRGRHYAEWKAEQAGKPTVRGQIRKDIDEAAAFTYKSFLEEMKKRGYAIKYGANVKHTAVKPAGSKRFFRLDTLGGGYTEETIKERLFQSQTSGKFYLPKQKRQRRVSARLCGDYKKGKKLSGVRALYWRYLYLLGKVKKRTAPKRISPFLYEDMARFERYVKQYRFLTENGIGTEKDLIEMKSFFHGEIDRLVESRAVLYQEVRKKGEKANENMEYQSYSREIKELRRKARQCESILETAQKIRDSLQEIKETSEKEVTYEPRKRSSRTNDKGNFEDFRNSSETDRNRG